MYQKRIPYANATVPFVYGVIEDPRCSPLLFPLLHFFLDPVYLSV